MDTTETAPPSSPISECSESQKRSVPAPPAAPVRRRRHIIVDSEPEEDDAVTMQRLQASLDAIRERKAATRQRHAPSSREVAVSDTIAWSRQLMEAETRAARAEARAAQAESAARERDRERERERERDIMLQQQQLQLRRTEYSPPCPPRHHRRRRSCSPIECEDRWAPIRRRPCSRPVDCWPLSGITTYNGCGPYGGGYYGCGTGYAAFGPTWVAPIAPVPLVTQTPVTTLGTVCSVNGGGCSTTVQPAIQTCTPFGCRTDVVGPPNLPSLPSWYA